MRSWEKDYIFQRIFIKPIDATEIFQFVEKRFNPDVLINSKCKFLNFYWSWINCNEGKFKPRVLRQIELNYWRSCLVWHWDESHHWDDIFRSWQARPVFNSIKISTLVVCNGKEINPDLMAYQTGFWESQGSKFHKIVKGTF